jgi:hypothetical protein
MKSLYGVGEMLPLPAQRQADVLSQLQKVVDATSFDAT